MAGATVTAKTGIEIALWDLAGKALGVPVYQLLGGKFRDTVRLYCDSHAGRDFSPESYAERAREVVALGFDALKFDVDETTAGHRNDAWNWHASGAEIAWMVERVAAVRARRPERRPRERHARPHDFAADPWRGAGAVHLRGLEAPVPPRTSPRCRGERACRAAGRGEPYRPGVSATCWRSGGTYAASEVRGLSVAARSRRWRGLLRPLAAAQRLRPWHHASAHGRASDPVLL